MLTFAGIVADGDTAAGDVALVFRVRDVGESDSAGEAIADVERHDYCLFLRV